MVHFARGVTLVGEGPFITVGSGTRVFLNEHRGTPAAGELLNTDITLCKQFLVGSKVRTTVLIWHK